MSGSDAELRAEHTGLRLTPAGRVVLPFAVAGVLVAWIAGGTAGLASATFFALLALAPLVAWLHLRGVRVTPPPAMRVTAGDPFFLVPVLTNRSPFFSVSHVVAAAGDSRGGPTRAGGRLDRLRPGERRPLPVAHRLLRRGRTRTLRLEVTSCFPLALVECRLRFTLPVDLLALPRLGTLSELTPLTAGIAETSRERRQRGTGEEEFHAVRQWREGESLRRVHWRLSARRGRRILREFQTVVEAPVHLVLAAWMPGEGLADAARRHFETSVSLAATLSEHFLRRGRRVRLTVLHEGAAALPAVRGRGGLARILGTLAEVEPLAIGAAEERTLAADPGRRRGEVPILVHAGGGDVLPPLGATLSADTLILGAADPRTDRIFRRVRPGGMRSPLSPLRA